MAEGLTEMLTVIILSHGCTVSMTTQKEIKDLAIEKEGITSFKTFMAYKGALMMMTDNDWINE